MNRLKLFGLYCLDRMGETSTWQGVGFLVTAFGSKFGAGLDWGGAAFVGGFVSAAIKAAFPDKIK
jgi:hypothetical protein